MSVWTRVCGQGGRGSGECVDKGVSQDDKCPPNSELKQLHNSPLCPDLFRMPVLSSEQLLMGLTHQGIALLAAVIQAPGSPIRKVAFPSLTTDTVGHTYGLRNKQRIQYLELLLKGGSLVPGLVIQGNEQHAE